MKQSEPPSKWDIENILAYILMVIFLVAFWWYVITAFINATRGIRDSVLSLSCPINTEEKVKDDRYILLNENALMAYYPPITIKNQVLGVAGLTTNQETLLDKLWLCESSRRHEGVWGDNGRAYGAFQYWPGTFFQYCEGSRYNFEDQLRCAKYMIFDLRIGHLHWVNCFRRFNLNQYLR